MAASTGDDDIQETSTGEKTSLSSTTLQQNTEKVKDVSTNGTVSHSLFVGANKITNILRPSVFSSNAASGNPMPVFGSNVSSSHFDNSSLKTFGNSSQKNPFSLRPGIFGSASCPDKDIAVKRPVVLRASQLEPVPDSPVSSTTNHSNSSFILSPAKLNNPFFKPQNSNDDSSNNLISSTCPEETINSDSAKAHPSNNLFESPKVSFVPLESSSSTHKPEKCQTTGSAGNSTNVSRFVFGQNLHERVEVSSETTRSEADSNEAMTSDTSSCDEVSKTNGATPEMLFSSVIQRELSDVQSDIGNEERKRKSLSEAAREYEESRAIKKKYEEVTVKTGEEEEINILQINCKLFAFNKDKSTWVERGRGTLRLNDLSVESRTQSRVVMRVSGSLRVVLNTKIWAEMAVDRPSEKSVRLTAMDSSGEIKVFLIMAGVKEIDQLFKALEWRVNNQKKVASVCGKNSETSKS